MDLKALAKEWGNPEWAAPMEFLEEITHWVPRTRGPVLELGCGLTSRVLYECLKNTGRPLHIVEHMPEWAARTRPFLGPRSADVVMHVTDLKKFGSARFYDISRVKFPTAFGLVICDGPPGGENRALAREHLDPYLRSWTVILADDARRDRAHITKWGPGIYDYKDVGRGISIVRPLSTEVLV